jgi:ABC-2 type transport system ATP-binding protein
VSFEVRDARESMVVVSEVSKRYGRTVALDGVSLEVAHGERYALLGPNGAGKTTLIHIICTIHPADSGTVTVGGWEVHKQPRRARQALGVVFQEPSLDTRLTVAENLEFHGQVFGVPRQLRRRRINDLLELVELADRRDKLVSSLSKGMQRRLEIARALVHDARVLVLDEPTVGLDAQTRARMWDYIAEVQRRHELTVLVTTHYIEEVDDCDKVCIIDHGKVLAVDTPAALKSAHGRTLVKVTARDEAAAEKLLETYPGSSVTAGQVVLPVDSTAAVTEILRTHSDEMEAMTVESPTLESVFLSLTGRAIRDPSVEAEQGGRRGVRGRG